MFTGLSPNKTYNVHNPRGLKLLKRPCLGLSYIRVHKFYHHFSDCLDEFYICGTNIESMNQFLLHCPLYIFERKKSLMLRFGLQMKMKILLIIFYTLLVINLVTLKASVWILNATMKYILSTKKS